MAKVETGGKGGVEVAEEVLNRICSQARAFKRLGRNADGLVTRASKDQAKAPRGNTPRGKHPTSQAHFAPAHANTYTSTHLRKSKAAGEVGQLHHILGF